MSSPLSVWTEDIPDDSGNILSQSPTENSNVFSVLIGSSKLAADTIVKDKCKRLIPTYNHNYNPDKLPPTDLPGGYLLYVFGEPLFDDRAVLLARLPP
jgi:hypothetical protein